MQLIAAVVDIYEYPAGWLCQQRRVCGCGRGVRADVAGKCCGAGGVAAVSALGPRCEEHPLHCQAARTRPQPRTARPHVGGTARRACALAATIQGWILAQQGPRRWGTFYLSYGTFVTMFETVNVGIFTRDCSVPRCRCPSVPTGRECAGCIQPGRGGCCVSARRRRGSRAVLASRHGRFPG